MFSKGWLWHFAHCMPYAEEHLRDRLGALVRRPGDAVEARRGLVQRVAQARDAVSRANSSSGRSSADGLARGSGGSCGRRACSTSSCCRASRRPTSSPRTYANSSRFNRAYRSSLARLAASFAVQEGAGLLGGRQRADHVQDAPGAGTPRRGRPRRVCSWSSRWRAKTCSSMKLAGFGAAKANFAIAS